MEAPTCSMQEPCVDQRVSVPQRRKTPPRLYTTKLLTLVMLNSCGANDETQEVRATTTRDSAGVTIVEHDSSAWLYAAQWRISNSPLIDIGRHDSIGAYNFFRVRSVSRLSTGDIVVANGGSQEIRIFDSSGRHLKTVGRSGSGPGEFQDLVLAQVIRGDSIAAFDGLQARITIFDGDGQFARSVRVPVAGYVRHIFGDGTLVVGKVQFPSWEPGVLRGTTTLLHIADTEVRADTIGRFPSTEFFDQAGGQYVEYRPFGKVLETMVDHSHLYLGTGDSYEFRVISRDGTLRRILRGPALLERVTQEHIDSYTARRIAGTIDPRRKEGLRRLARNNKAFFPETMPAHGSLRVGVGAELWVQDYQADPDGTPRWRVFGPDGKPLATMTTPRHYSVMGFGPDWVVGVWRDELDREHVRVYGLARK